ncbi:hypothetical protein FRB93_012609 [Tulasnella sp. JGI-2019a]|nr:hypothetical protein FRB93_012609 [Tulasnella sp. JGI-2019a]
MPRKPQHNLPPISDSQPVAGPSGAPPPLLSEGCTTTVEENNANWSVCGSSQVDAEVPRQDLGNWPKKGSFEAHYEILECIGQGGFRKIFKVRRLADSATMAYKVVNYPHDRSRVKRMANELSIWQGLNHPAIVRLLESIKGGEYTIYYIMPHFTGHSLAKDCKEQSYLQAYTILVPIMDTLISNAGTLGWNALEVEEGGKAHGEKVDSYGIGLLFWWFIFGRTSPIDRMVVPNVINWAALEGWGVPDDFKDFLGKLLAQEPSERWTVRMAREHHLIKDFTWSTDSPEGSVAGGAAPTDSDASVIPEVAALPVTSIGIPPLGPVENTPITAKRSEDAVEAMIIIEASSVSEFSGVLSFPLHAGPTSGKRGRETSISITGPVEVTADGEQSMKWWKGSV